MRGFFTKQPANIVLKKEPGNNTYNPPELASRYAPLHWEYAVMSLLAYDEALDRAKLKKTKTTPLASTLEKSPTLPGWSRWIDFPSTELLSKCSENGLYVDVWERVEHPRTIAVIFEGTNFWSWNDWKANSRWLLRFIPGYEDQYSIAANEVSREFYERLVKNPDKYSITPGHPFLLTHDNKDIKIVTSGHSLGGGLAQHFAYSFPQPFSSGGPKISEVFAFDSSPVTGWFVVPQSIRSYNVKDLQVYRIFEHGEVLAYVRLITSRFTATFHKNPSIWEFRYNFDSSWAMINNHSIKNLANGLVKAAN